MALKNKETATHKNKKLDKEWVIFASFLITIKTPKIEAIKDIKIQPIIAFLKNGYSSISNIFFYLWLQFSWFLCECGLCS